MTALYIVYGIIGLFVYLQIGYLLGYLYIHVYTQGNRRNPLTWLMFPLTSYLDDFGALSENPFKWVDLVVHGSSKPKTYRLFKAFTWPLSLFGTILLTLVCCAFYLPVLFLVWVVRIFWRIIATVITWPAETLATAMGWNKREQEEITPKTTGDEPETDEQEADDIEIEIDEAIYGPDPARFDDLQPDEEPPVLQEAPHEFKIEILSGEEKTGTCILGKETNDHDCLDCAYYCEPKKVFSIVIDGNKIDEIIFDDESEAMAAAESLVESMSKRPELYNLNSNDDNND